MAELAENGRRGREDSASQLVVDWNDSGPQEETKPMPVRRRTRKKSEPTASRPHMPGYGLPKGTKGLLPWKWALQRLIKSHNYWIVTTRPDGRPHLMLVWGLWMEEAFYFSTGRHSRKAQNLTKNSHCTIGTENAAEAVILEGIAHEVMEIPARRKFLADCQRKYKFDMSAYEADILKLKEPIYAVKPSVGFGLHEKKTLNTATRWRFPK
jgi:hypothetical protein